MIKAYLYQRKQPRLDKSSKDLELMLYSRILKNDMLHYGYFDDPDIPADSISISLFEESQLRYAQLIIDQIMRKDKEVLDVGCGMGGLSNILNQEKFMVEALTPDQNQKKHFQLKYPKIRCHQMKFENFHPEKPFGTIINSESLQYIKLDKAFLQANKILAHGGRWIITDYFRTKQETSNQSGHLIYDFLNEIEKKEWKVAHEQDITPNILPTLRLVNFYIERFLRPLQEFGIEKFKQKKAWLYCLTEKTREKFSKKIEKALVTVDPEIFVQEKKYMFYVLEKTQS